MEAAPVAGGGAGGNPPPVAPPPGGNPPPATGWSQTFFKADGSLDHAALEKIPEAHKNLIPTLSTLKTENDFYGKIASLNALAGRKGLAPLPANASPEDIAAQTAVLRAVMGTPEKADGYGFKKPDDLPAEAWDDGYAKSASEILHKHNASPGLAKDLMALADAQTRQMIQANVQAEQAFYTAQDNEFREALKKSGDDYDKVMNVVTVTAEKFGLPKDHPILKNAGTRAMLHAVAKAIGEPEFKGGNGGELQTKSDEALADDIVHNKANPDYAAYWDANHKMNRSVVERVTKLREAAAVKAQQAASGKR